MHNSASMVSTRRTTKTPTLLARLRSVMQADPVLSANFKTLIRPSPVGQRPFSVLVGQELRWRGEYEKYYYPVYARFGQRTHGELRLEGSFNSKLYFHTFENYRVKDPEPEIDFAAPFCYLQPASSDQFRSVVLFYAMANTPLEETPLPAAFLKNFREACAKVADASKHTNATAPYVLSAPTNVRIVNMVEDISDDSDAEASSGIASAVEAHHCESSNDRAVTNSYREHDAAPS